MVHQRHPEARGWSDAGVGVLACRYQAVSVRRRKTPRSRRLVGRRKGCHKLSSTICKLSSSRPCSNPSGRSGIHIRVHSFLPCSWRCPPPGPPDLSLSCSACSCREGFDFHCPSLPAAADVAVSMTYLGTIAQPARKLGSWSSGLCVGVCGCSGVQRSSRQSLDQYDGQGLGCGRAESGRTSHGDSGGRVATVLRSKARRRHHHGVTTAPRWDCQAGSCALW